jgi:hypothetical protein
VVTSKAPIRRREKEGWLKNAKSIAFRKPKPHELPDFPFD